MTQIWKYVVSIPLNEKVFVAIRNHLISAPYQPENITVSASFVSQHVYQLNVSWDKPKRQPASYSIVISDRYNHTTEREVPGVN